MHLLPFSLLPCSFPPETSFGRARSSISGKLNSSNFRRPGHCLGLTLDSRGDRNYFLVISEADGRAEADKPQGPF